MIKQAIPAALRHNPFRGPMAKAFDGCLQAYSLGHHDIVRDGRRCKGNSIAAMFWRGYDGVLPGGYADRASRQLLAWAYWRAGQTARLQDDQQGVYIPKD